MSGSNGPLPPETVARDGRRLTFYDLSDCLSNSTNEFEFNKHQIDYITPAQTAESFGLGPAFWPGGLALQAEMVSLSTHSGTHVDAPAHYGPAVSGETMTIDLVPLSWCYGPGVLIDVRSLDRVEGITRGFLEGELQRIGHTLRPGDVVLVMTGTDLRRPGYENTHAGLRREATEYLVDQGVRLIGIDAWTVDRAVDVMIEEAKAGTLSQAFESHVLGRDKPYLQIERLANLDQLPAPTGFTVVAFPFKLEGASAGWARVVAIADVPDS